MLTQVRALIEANPSGHLQGFFALAVSAFVSEHHLGRAEHKSLLQYLP
jgi:hypothetical protein